MKISNTSSEETNGKTMEEQKAMELREKRREERRRRKEEAERLEVLKQVSIEKLGLTDKRTIGVYELATREFLANTGKKYIVTESGNREFNGKVWVDIDVMRYKNIIYSFIGNLAYLGEIYAKNVSEVMNLANYQTFIPDDKFDKKENLITFSNGTYDLETHELREFRKSDYVTSNLNYDFNPDAKCPEWKKFVSNIMTKDEVDFMQEFVGYSLTRSTKHQVMLWLVGRPGTGKSTFTETIGKLFGDMATDLSLGEIGKNRFALHAIKGKTLIFSSESGDGTGVFRETDLINRIVTGDAVTLEEKYGQRINNYKPFAKVIWSMNTPPTIADSKNGIFRRLRYIKIDKPIKEQDIDNELPKKLEAEFEGIIQWAIEGLKRLNERGYMLTPKTIEDNNQRYKDDNDKIGNFASDLLVMGEELKVKQSRLYDLYVTWCKRSGYMAESSTKFASKITQIDGVTKKKSGVNRIYGLGIDTDKHETWINGVGDDIKEDAENRMAIQEMEKKMLQEEIAKDIPF